MRAAGCFVLFLIAIALLVVATLPSSQPTLSQPDRPDSQPDSQPDRPGLVESTMQAAAAGAAKAINAGIHISSDEYRQIETGMTYDQVKEIIGRKPDSSSSSEVAGEIWLDADWINADGSNAVIGFTNGLVTTRTQIDLPRRPVGHR